MKKLTIRMISFFVFILLLTETVITVNAGGAEGYAIYKDEVFGTSLSWHSGLMDKENTTLTDPVIHLKSFSSSLSDGATVKVSVDSCEHFLNGGNISRYYYTSNDTPISYYLAQVRDKARDLGGVNGNRIYTYHFFKQIEYNVVENQYTVFPADITGFRCDGVVEYSYEYYGHRIYGGDDYWNIARMGRNYKNEHKTTVFNLFHPKLVAQNYMTAAHIIADVDGDGTVSAEDSRLALRYSVGSSSLTDMEKARADVDFDGSITASDARIITRIATGLE